MFLFDLGDNLAGWAQLVVEGPRGAEVTMRHAENLDAEGRADLVTHADYVNSGDFQTNRYTLKGEGKESWEPRFTYHGFRYVQVSGFPGRPNLESVRGRRVHTSFAPAGEFACSNDLLNRIQEATRRSYVSNFLSIPTDCPHREKLGWTGDAHLAAEQGLLNFDSASAYAKWMNDFDDEQRASGELPCIIPSSGLGYDWGNGPAWDSAYLLIPWYLYLYRGDLRPLRDHYPGMKRYVDYLGTRAEDHIVTIGLGDWAPPEGPPEGREKAPIGLTSSAYYYVDARLLSRAALLLGNAEEATHYGALAKAIRTAVNRRFCDPDTGRYAGGTQTAQSCALYQGLVEPELRPKVVEQLLRAVKEHRDHLDCGVLGAKYLLHALTESGHADLAYNIATQTDFPSWGYWIAQGATTLWESWGSKGAFSRNHIMFGDISAWFYRALAGLRPDPARPGFKHTIIRPHPVGDLTWVQASHLSRYGLLKSDWRIEGDRFLLDVHIPSNTTATVHLPTTDPDSIREGGHAAGGGGGGIFPGGRGGAGGDCARVRGV